MAFTSKYNKTDFLKLVHTGNTVGIGYKVGNPNTFISLDTLVNSLASVGVSTNPNTYAGNTTDWKLDGSWALLNPSTSDVPVGSTVDFAALLWCTCGSSVIPVTLVDATSVIFGLPNGTTVPISPDPTYTANATVSPFYTRGREVTSIINSLPNSGFGDYSVSGIPGNIGNNLGIGWSLIVVYKNNAMPLRNVSVFTGFLANGTSTPITGFYTPTSGIVNARAYIMCQYGFSGLVGDTYTLNGTDLYGPRNPVNNFFCAQVCDYQGNLLTTSSFGDRNSTPNLPPTGPTGDRVDFDITNVSANGVLANAQRSSTIKIAGNGDIVNANAAALEVDSNAPNISLTKSAVPTSVSPGDTVTYTVVVKNTGPASATNVLFMDTIPTGTSFINDTVTINGSPAPTGTDPQAGFTLNTLDATSGVSTITFKVILNSTGFISGQTIPNTAFTGYTFISDPSLPAINGSTNSNIAIVAVSIPSVSISKKVNYNYATSNDTIEYTFVINNLLNPSTVTNIILFDTIPTGLTFVPGSVLVNNVSFGGNPSPQNGLTIPDVAGSSLTTIVFNATVNTIPNVNSATNIGYITASQDSSILTKISNTVVTTINYSNSIGTGNTSTITFQVVINTIPNPNPIPNDASITYSYSNITSTITKSSSTNTVNTQVNFASLGGITKFVDKAYAICGEIITYTISIPNSGNITATNVVLSDTVPNGTSFISNSILVNGSTVGGTPQSIALGSIAPGATTTVSYEVTVVC